MSSDCREGTAGRSSNYLSLSGVPNEGRGIVDVPSDPLTSAKELVSAQIRCDSPTAFSPSGDGVSSVHNGVCVGFDYATNESPSIPVLGLKRKIMDESFSGSNSFDGKVSFAIYPLHL